jgi:hypothetical protein
MRDEKYRREDVASQILYGKDRIENALCYYCKTRVTLNKTRSLTLLSYPPQHSNEYQCSQCGQQYTYGNMNKLIEFNKEYAGIPLTGNEYIHHIKQKKRIHDLLVLDGWSVEYEKAVHCRDPHTHLLNKYPFYLDVYAERHIEEKLMQIGVEIHGEKGHGSKYTIATDKNRNSEIWNQHRIKVIEFYLWQLTSSKPTDLDDKNILTEIYDKIGIPI